MEKLFFMLIVMLCLIQPAKADTIDTWQIYYNGKKIENFNQFGRKEIILKLDSISTGDLITVRYYRDTPCANCITYLTVENEKHHIYLTSEGKGTFNPISFSVNKLKEFREQGYLNTFEVFYFEGGIKSPTGKIFLFRITLE